MQGKGRGRRARVEAAMGERRGLRDHCGGDDFAGPAPDSEAVDNHNARFGEGGFEVGHAGRKLASSRSKRGHSDGDGNGEIGEQVLREYIERATVDSIMGGSRERTS